tara:strand:+ start:3566 stop:4873 length:1308 start_codon:yes stop_codon:yes gene_type:complete
MGANQSSNNIDNKDTKQKEKSFKKTIDYIAANYILTNNFQDLKNLNDPKYCNNLVILTSKVLNDHLTTREIEFLKQRMEGTNTDSPKEINKLTKETITYFSDKDIPKLNVTKPLKRKRICIGIAKYYIEIFNLFNSIVHTINPVYTWRDSTGQMVSVDYQLRKDIPKNVTPTITRNNLCSNRLNALLNEKDICGNDITINPRKNKDVLNISGDPYQKNLQQEIGIPELEKMYYDEYNFDVGKFTGMSEKMKKEIYKKDVKSLYTIFTGNTDVPENIESFSDIILSDISLQNVPKVITGSLKEELFNVYVTKWKEMKINIEKYQNELLNILEEIFTPIEDPDDPNKQIIIIRKDLTQEKLDNLFIQTRNTILNLYASCEENYQEILKILDAIIENQEKETAELKIQNLQEEKQRILAKQELLQKDIDNIDDKIKLL